MKFTKTYKLLILICFPFLFYGQKDTLKVKRLAVYVSPSQVFFGDIPLGIEHQLTKRISHELFVYVKTFNPIINIYEYNKGLGVKYFFNYTFYKRKRNNWKLNLGYAYRHLYFNNKASVPPFQSGDININGQTSVTKYNMSKLFITHTAVVGISYQTKLYKNMYFGLTSFFEYGKSQKTIDINDKNYNQNLNNTHYNLTNKQFGYAHFIVKIIFEFPNAKN